MLSIFNLDWLSQAEVEDLPWLASLYEAKAGSNEAATIMLAGLAWHLQQNSLTERQRMFLSDALAAIADAAPGPDRMKATKDQLLLGRGPGGTPRYLAELGAMRRAMSMWLREGDVPDQDLDAACQRVLDWERSDAPDPRSLKRAYKKYRGMFRLLGMQAGNS